MLNRWKRLLALLASVAVLFSLCTAASAAPGEQAEPRELTEADYAAADAIFASLPSADGTNSGAAGAADTGALCDWLETADGVRPGTVSANGSCVTWQTDAGITCSYNPQLERISERAQEPAQTETLESIPALRGVQHGRDVYLFQPYYGLDSSFTRQYYEEGQRIAAKSEGTFYYYKTEAATVDAIAGAVESGGVILFDSHGTTDYTGDNEDYTSKATTSYLCLQSGDGLTTEDYADGHAVYGGSGINGMRYYEVDGTVIANHMEKPANGGLVWMAICLGMATDGLEGPLMDAGAGVVYGYSQSVTFIGDYCFEEEFFNKLLQGGTVAESIRTMKARYGNWDCSPAILGSDSSQTAATLEEAVRKHAAFPIVVSAEDAYPGHGKVDAVQEVSSVWSLLESFTATVTTDAPKTAGTVVQKGMTVTAVPARGYYADGATVTPEGAAVVTQEGDLFRISSLRADCTITIHFSAKTPAVLHFAVPDGVTQADIQSYVGDAEPLPLPAGTPAADAQDYSFAGWSLQEQAEPVGSLSYLRAGSEFAVAQPEQTLYAVYRYFATPAGTTPAFHELTEAPEDWSGTYVLSAAGRALLCDGSVTGAALGSSEAAVPFADAGLAEENGALRGVSAAVVVQIERVTGTEQYAIRLGGTSDAVYLACRSNSEQLNTAQDAGTSLSRWVISMEDGHMTIRSARYLSRTLQYDADVGCFRCYAKTKTPLTVYRGETSSLWYTTQPKMHDHQLVETGRREPTCTMSGWIDFRCTICGELRRQPLEPLGHEVVNGLCVRCGEVMQLPFRDVPENAYFYDAVVWGLSRGVVNGTTMTTFSPDLSCTRAQAVTFLWRAAGMPESSGNTAFADVPADSYYAAAVAWAAENGFTNGTGGGCFSPDAPCTRAQIVTFLWRAAGEPESSGSTAFADVPAGSYYAAAVAWAAENNVTNGTGSGCFSPDDLCTRAQIVTLLYRQLTKEI